MCPNKLFSFKLLLFLKSLLDLLFVYSIFFEHFLLFEVKLFFKFEEFIVLIFVWLVFVIKFVKVFPGVVNTSIIPFFLMSKF